VGHHLSAQALLQGSRPRPAAPVVPGPLLIFGLLRCRRSCARHSCGGEGLWHMSLYPGPFFTRLPSHCGIVRCPTQSCLAIFSVGPHQVPSQVAAALLHACQRAEPQVRQHGGEPPAQGRAPSGCGAVRGCRNARRNASAELHRVTQQRHSLGLRELRDRGRRSKHNFSACSAAVRRAVLAL